MADTERIRELERQVAELTRRMRRIVERPAILQSPRHVRTALTKAEDGESYPTFGLTSVFPAVFLDGEFDGGNINWIGERQGDDERILVGNITGGPIPETIAIAVWWERNNWWCEHDAEVWGKLDGALDPSGYIGLSIWNIYAGENGDEEIDTEDAVDVWAPPVFRSGEIDAGVWAGAKWDRKTQRFILHDVECDP